MLLDFFATFFSSATALLPIFAQDILHVGAQGYGWLYSASAVGAVAGSLAMVPLAHRIDGAAGRSSGRSSATALATVVFGLSRSFWLTFVCLAWAGASDAVSMVIRNLVRQLETPDALRGRTVGHQHGLLHGRSAARRAGSRPRGPLARRSRFSVVTGGVGCLIATAAIAASTPELRRYRREADPGGHR